jgi:ABC-type multidrug transport system ATPase subunit
LSLARAILHDPDLLLLDEPYTGLDVRGVATLQDVLATAKDQGKTVVLTTHDFSLGLAISNRVLILHHGRVSWEAKEQLPSVQEFGEIYQRTTQPSTPNPQSLTLDT